MSLQDSKETVRESSMCYVRYAIDLLTKRDDNDSSPRLVFISPLHRLRSIVESVESSAEFNALCTTINTDTECPMIPRSSFRWSKTFLNDRISITTLLTVRD